MTVADISLELPDMKIGNKDLVFHVFDSQGNKLGRLALSSGTVDWYPRDAKKPAYRRRWAKFIQLLEDSG
jgi:hypothetical protein